MKYTTGRWRQIICIDTAAAAAAIFAFQQVSAPQEQQ